MSTFNIQSQIGISASIVLELPTSLKRGNWLQFYIPTNVYFSQ